jgi:hypothetical protein
LLRFSVIVAAVVLALAAVSCRRSDASACGQIVREPLDSRSTQHLFPDTPDPSFLTNPPTSGPHRPGLHPSGVLHDPIGPGVQVSMLEGGGVLIQYNNVTDAQRARLERLAGGPVTVAPNATLPAKIVATAWTAKLTCNDVDSDALENFARQYVGKGAGHA